MGSRAPRLWTLCNFCEKLISLKVTDVLFCFFSCWFWRAAGLRWTRRGDLFCLRQSQDSPPPLRKAARPLNLARESCWRCSSYLWTHLIRLLQVIFYIWSNPMSQFAYWRFACDTIMFDRPVFAFVTSRGLESTTQTCHRYSTSVVGVSGGFQYFLVQMLLGSW